MTNMQFELMTLQTCTIFICYANNGSVNIEVKIHTSLDTQNSTQCT